MILHENGAVQPAEREGLFVVAVGDSITAGNPDWDPDPAGRERENGFNPESQYLFWAAKCNPGMGFRNAGVGGERCDEIAARLEANLDGADVLVVQGGINDVVQKRSIELAVEDLRGMVRRGLELGLPVVMPDVLPWNKGWPDNEQTIRDLNALLRAMAAEEGIPVLAFHDALEDPDRPGRMRQEWTNDGNHPNVAGHRVLGETAFVLPERQR
jgi:lysophospholipase L1-like esterase